MKIGIIGAGNSGGTLTRRFTALGHKVFVANSRGPETLADLATETGAVRQALAKASKERKLEWGLLLAAPGCMNIRREDHEHE